MVGRLENAYINTVNLPCSPFLNKSCLCNCIYTISFQMVTPEKYEVKGSIQEAAIILVSCTEPKMQVTITLTSPVIREENGRDGGWEIHNSPSYCPSFLVLLLCPYESISVCWLTP